MGTVRKHGRVYWIRYSRNGKRYEENTHFTKEKDARDLLKVREGDIAKGLPVSPKVARLTFEDAAGDLLADYKVNGKRSREHVEHRVNVHLASFFAGRRMASITTADIRAYIALRQQAGAANATVNRELAALKRMFNLALQASRLLHRPHIPMLQENNARPGFFEREQFLAVKSRLADPLRPVVEFAYYTGWRIRSEVLPLTWSQVDRQACVVRLDPGTTKNREGRVFDFSQLPVLRDLFDAQWLRHEELKRARNLICPFVFNRNGKRIITFWRAWRAACDGAGCPGRIPHDLRRTAVRNLVRAGVPERVAMTVTGHKTRAVFDRYNIVAPEDLREAGRRLAAATA